VFRCFAVQPLTTRSSFRMSEDFPTTLPTRQAPAQPSPDQRSFEQRGNSFAHTLPTQALPPDL
jgi:hypothetical protein